MGENKILDEVGEMGRNIMLDEVGERGEADIVKDQIRQKTSKSVKGEYG